MTKIPVYLIFGPQGSGKSTQAELLSTKLNLPYFDTGKELRQYIAADHPNSQKIKAVVESGMLVDNDLLKLIITNFLERFDCTGGVVIDGFPRNIAQIDLMEKLAEEKNWHVLAYYVHISDEIAKERLSKRHTIVNGKKTFRTDDTPAIVAKRLQVFKEETLPVIEHYRKNDQLIEIDGEPSRQEVFQQITDSLDG